MKKAPVLSLIIVFLIPLLIGFKSLSTPFTLIDDGEIIKNSVQFAKTKDLKLFLNVDAVNGRVRPVFWLASFVPFLFSGANPISYHFYHILFYSLNAALIFLIIFTISKSPISASLGSLGFTFTTSSNEIWNRLGPQEPYMIFFLLIALYNIVKIYYKKNIGLSLSVAILSLFLATFTKETTLAIIPSLFILILLSALALKKITNFVQSLIVITLSEMLFGITLFFIRFNNTNISGYTSQFSFNKAFLIKNFDLYVQMLQKDTGWFLPISIFMFFIIVIKKSKDLRHDTTMFKVFCMFFFSLSAFLLFAQIPWNYVLGRYLPPVFMPLFIFIGCSISYFFSITRRLKKATLGRYKVLGHLLFVFFILYSLIFFFFQIKETSIEISQIKDRAIVHSDMVKNLAKSAYTDTKIYFVIYEGAFEYAYETGLHLDLFYGKKNKITRLNPYLLPDLKNGDIIVVSGQYQEIPDSILNQILSNKTLLYHTYLWTIYKIER